MGPTVDNWTYRFYLVNGLDRVQINPLGSIQINWELQDDSFFYEKTVGSFKVAGLDYEWIRAIEEAGDICKILYVEVERRCDGVPWELYARSQWTIQSCRFENSKCNITVNPEATGLGACLVSRGSDVLNILQEQFDKTGFKFDGLTYISDFVTDDLLGYNNGHMFYYNAPGIENILIRPQYTNAAGNPSTSGTPSLPPTADELFTGGFIPENEVDLIAIHRVGVYQLNILSPPWVIYVAWAYRRAELKVAGVCPDTPNGYTYIGDDVTYCYYQKKPTDSDNSVVLGSVFDACNSIGPIPSSSDLVYNGVRGTSPGIPGTGLCLFVFHKDTRQHITLSLEALLQIFIDQCDPDKICVSDFFQINPENASSINYVTGQPSLTNDIRFQQRSDAIFQFLENATVGEMSWNDLAQFLRNSFQTFWSEDFDGNLRLEHYSYYDNITVSIDTTIGEKAKFTNKRTNYTYKRELLPFIENVNDDGNHHNYNWDDREIKYVDTDGNKLGCIGSSNLDRSFGIFNTDYEFFIEYPTEIPRSGWVCIACRVYMGTDEIIYEDGLLNGTLSMKRLIERYYNHGRSALNAKVNGVDTVFETTVKLKEEEDLVFPLCCDDTFDPRENIKTPNGIARTTSASHDLKTDKLSTNNEY